MIEKNDNKKKLVQDLIFHYEPKAEFTDEYYNKISVKYDSYDDLVTALIGHYEPKANVTSGYLDGIYKKYDITKEIPTEFQYAEEIKPTKKELEVPEKEPRELLLKEEPSYIDILGYKIGSRKDLPKKTLAQQYQDKIREEPGPTKTIFPVSLPKELQPDIIKYPFFNPEIEQKYEKTEEEKEKLRINNQVVETERLLQDLKYANINNDVKEVKRIELTNSLVRNKKRLTELESVKWNKEKRYINSRKEEAKTNKLKASRKGTEEIKETNKMIKYWEFKEKEHNLSPEILVEALSEERVSAYDIETTKNYLNALKKHNPIYYREYVQEIFGSLSGEKHFDYNKFVNDISKGILPISVTEPEDPFHLRKGIVSKEIQNLFKGKKFLHDYTDLTRSYKSAELKLRRDTQLWEKTNLDHKTKILNDKGVYDASKKLKRLGMNIEQQEEKAKILNNSINNNIKLGIEPTQQDIKELENLSANLKTSKNKFNTLMNDNIELFKIADNLEDEKYKWKVAYSSLVSIDPETTLYPGRTKQLNKELQIKELESSDEWYKKGTGYTLESWNVIKNNINKYVVGGAKLGKMLNDAAGEWAGGDYYNTYDYFDAVINNFARNFEYDTKEFVDEQKQFIKDDGSLDWTRIMPFLTENIMNIATIVYGGQALGTILKSADLGLLLSGAILEGQNVYEESMEQGMTVEQATIRSLITSFTTASLEFVSPNKFLIFGKGKPISSDFKNLIRNNPKEAFKSIGKYAYQAGKEMTFEELQELSQSWNVYGTNRIYNKIYGTDFQESFSEMEFTRQAVGVGVGVLSLHIMKSGRPTKYSRKLYRDALYSAAINDITYDRTVIEILRQHNEGNVTKKDAERILKDLHITKNAFDKITPTHSNIPEWKKKKLIPHLTLETTYTKEIEKAKEKKGSATLIEKLNESLKKEKQKIKEIMAKPNAAYSINGEEMTKEDIFDLFNNEEDRKKLLSGEYKIDFFNDEAGFSQFADKLDELNEEEKERIPLEAEIVLEKEETERKVIAEREEYDKKIIKAQKELGLEDTPDIEIPLSVEITLDKLDKKEPVTNIFLKEASDYLYSKYKQLEKMKELTKREYTIEQIETMQEVLGEEITNLNNIINEQSKTGEFITEKIQLTDKIEVSKITKIREDKTTKPKKGKEIKKKSQPLIDKVEKTDDTADRIKDVEKQIEEMDEELEGIAFDVGTDNIAYENLEVRRDDLKTELELLKDEGRQAKIKAEKVSALKGKVTVPTEEFKEESTDIEAKKADIEKRRKEELKKNAHQITIRKTIYTGVDDGGDVTHVEIVETADGKKSIWALDENKKRLGNINKGYSIEISDEKLLEDLLYKEDAPITSEEKTVVSKALSKINAKYDVELATLEKKEIKEPEVKEPEVKEEKGDIEAKRQEELYEVLDKKGKERIDFFRREKVPFEKITRKIKVLARKTVKGIKLLEKYNAEDALKDPNASIEKRVAAKYALKYNAPFNVAQISDIQKYIDRELKGEYKASWNDKMRELKEIYDAELAALEKKEKKEPKIKKEKGKIIWAMPGIGKSELVKKHPEKYVDADNILDDLINEWREGNIPEKVTDKDFVKEILEDDKQKDLKPGLQAYRISEEQIAERTKEGKIKKKGYDIYDELADRLDKLTDEGKEVLVGSMPFLERKRLKEKITGKIYIGKKERMAEKFLREKRTKKEIEDEKELKKKRKKGIVTEGELAERKALKRAETLEKRILEATKKEKRIVLEKFLREELEPTEKKEKKEKELEKKKGFKLSTDKLKKDQHKADAATDFIGFGIGSTKIYSEDAKKQGIPVNDKIKPDDKTIAFVSVNGGNKLTAENKKKTLALINKVLNVGGKVIMDKSGTGTGQSHSKYNKSGEGVIQDEFMGTEGITVKLSADGKYNEFTKKELKLKAKQTEKEFDNIIKHVIEIDEKLIEKKGYAKEFYGSLKKHLLNLEIIIQKNAERPKDAPKTARASFNPNTNTISLFEGKLATVEELLHEMIHALIYNSFKSTKDYEKSQLNKNITEWAEKLFSHMKDNDLWKKLTPQQKFKLEKIIGDIEGEQKINPIETPAYIFSNPELAKFLNSIVYSTDAKTGKETSFWQKMKEIILDAVDKLTGNKSFLDELSDIMDRHLETEIGKVSKGYVTAKEGKIEIETKKYSTELLKKNPEKIYVFGDNLKRIGKGGQAIIRDEPNAIGIVTKKKPTTNDDAYFSDTDDTNLIENDIQKLIKLRNEGKTIIFPKTGIGTGLAMLEKKSPKLWNYLNKRLKEEFGFDNEKGISVTADKRVEPTEEAFYEEPGATVYSQALDEEITDSHEETYSFDSEQKVEAIQNTFRPLYIAVKEQKVDYAKEKIYTFAINLGTIRNEAEFKEKIKDKEEITATPKAKIPQNLQSGIHKYGMLVEATDKIKKVLGKAPRSIDMIIAGLRTRTTRSVGEMAKYNIKVGDIIEHYGISADGTTKRILTKITAIHPKGTPEYSDTWHKEGWRQEDIKVIEKLEAAIEFELLKKERKESREDKIIRKEIQKLPYEQFVSLRNIAKSSKLSVVSNVFIDRDGKIKFIKINTSKQLEEYIKKVNNTLDYFSYKRHSGSKALQLYKEDKIKERAKLTDNLQKYEFDLQVLEDLTGINKKIWEQYDIQENNETEFLYKKGDDYIKVKNEHNTWREIITDTDFNGIDLSKKVLYREVRRGNPFPKNSTELVNFLYVSRDPKTSSRWQGNNITQKIKDYFLKAAPGSDNNIKKLATVVISKQNITENHLSADGTMKNSYNLSSHLSLIDITDEKYKTKFFENNEIIKQHIADGTPFVIDEFGGVKNLKEGKNAESLTSEELLYSLMLDFSLSKSSYKQSLGQFGDGKQIYTTKVNKKKLSLKDYEKLYNKFTTKDQEFLLSPKEVKEYQDVINGKETEDKQLEDDVKLLNKSFERYADTLRDNGVKSKNDFIFQFFINNIINKSYTDQIIHGKFFQYDNVVEIIKRAQSSKSPGILLDTEIEGGVKKEYRYSTINDPIFNILDPKTKEILEKTFKGTDGVTIMSKSFADKIQISLGSILSRIKDYPDFLTTKALVSFINGDGGRGLLKSNWIVIDKLTQYSKILSTVKEIMDKHDIDVLGFQSASKKNIKKPFKAFEGNDIIYTDSEQTGIEIEDNVEIRRTSDIVIQQDLRYSSYPQSAKGSTQGIGNFMAMKNAQKISDLTVQEQEIALNEIENKLEYIRKEGNEKGYYLSLVNKDKNPDLYELIEKETSFDHPEIDNFIRNKLALILTKEAIEKTVNRTAHIEFPAIDMPLNSITIENGNTILGECIVNIEGIQYSEFLDGKQNKDEVIKYVNNNKEKFYYLFDKKGQLKEWTIKKEEKGNDKGKWHIPGEPVLVTRIPASGIESHSMLTAKYKGPQNIIITDRLTQVIAASDNDGDVRQVECVYKKRNGKIIKYFSEDDVKEMNTAEYNSSIYDNNVSIAINNAFKEVFGTNAKEIKRYNQELLKSVKTEIDQPIFQTQVRDEVKIKPTVKKGINFQEEQTTGYRNRTIKNASADATIAIAVDFNSAGEKLTKSSVLKQKKRYIPIDANNLTVTKERVNKIVPELNFLFFTDDFFKRTSKVGDITTLTFNEELNDINVKILELNDISDNKTKIKVLNLKNNNQYTYIVNQNGFSDVVDIDFKFKNIKDDISLNIAGNGIYTMKGKYTQEQVDTFTYNLLKQVIKSSNLKIKIESIRTGGQTGFDEAGAKAGIKLGIPTTILAPKGWTFRNIKGQDISNEKQFKERFDIVKKEEIEKTDTEKDFDVYQQRIVDYLNKTIKNSDISIRKYDPKKEKISVPLEEFQTEYKNNREALYNKSFEYMLEDYYDGKHYDIIVDPINTKVYDDTVNRTKEKEKKYSLNDLIGYIKAKEANLVGAICIGIGANMSTLFDYMKFHSISLKRTFNIPQFTVKDGEVIDGKLGEEEEAKTIKHSNIIKDIYGAARKALSTFQNLSLDDLKNPKINVLGYNEVTSNAFSLLLMTDSRIDKATDRKDADRIVQEVVDNISAFFNHTIVKDYITKQRNIHRLGSVTAKSDILINMLIEKSSEFTNSEEGFKAAKNYLYDIHNKEFDSTTDAGIVKTLKLLETFGYAMNDITKTIALTRKISGNDIEFNEQKKTYFKLDKNISDVFDLSGFKNDEYKFNKSQKFSNYFHPATKAQELALKYIFNSSITATIPFRKIFKNIKDNKNLSEKESKYLLSIFETAITLNGLNVNKETFNEIQEYLFNKVNEYALNPLYKKNKFFDYIQTVEIKEEKIIQIKEEWTKSSISDNILKEIHDDFNKINDQKFKRALALYAIYKYKKLSKSTFRRNYSILFSTDMHKSIGRDIHTEKERWRNDELKAPEIDNISKWIDNQFKNPSDYNILDLETNPNFKSDVTRGIYEISKMEAKTVSEVDRIIQKKSFALRNVWKRIKEIAKKREITPKEMAKEIYESQIKQKIVYMEELPEQPSPVSGSLAAGDLEMEDFIMNHFNKLFPKTEIFTNPKAFEEYIIDNYGSLEEFDLDELSNVFGNAIYLKSDNGLQTSYFQGYANLYFDALPDTDVTKKKLLDIFEGDKEAILSFVSLVGTDMAKEEMDNVKQLAFYERALIAVKNFWNRIKAIFGNVEAKKGLLSHKIAQDIWNNKEQFNASDFTTRQIRYILEHPEDITVSTDSGDREYLYKSPDGKKILIPSTTNVLKSFTDKHFNPTGEAKKIVDKKVNNRIRKLRKEIDDYNNAILKNTAIDEKNPSKKYDDLINEQIKTKNILDDELTEIDTPEYRFSQEKKLVDKWEKNNLIGTVIHKLAEVKGDIEAFKKIIFGYDIDNNIIKGIDLFKDNAILQNLATDIGNFIAKEIKEKSGKASSELIVYSTKNAIAGTIDLVIEDSDNNIYIYDFKTSETAIIDETGKLTEKYKKSYGNFSGKLSKFDKSKMYEHNIQLNIYAGLVEEQDKKNKIKKLYVIPIHYELDDGKIISTKIEGKIKFERNKEMTDIIFEKTKNNALLSKEEKTPKQIETRIKELSKKGYSPQSYHQLYIGIQKLKDYFKIDYLVNLTIENVIEALGSKNINLIHALKDELGFSDNQINKMSASEGLWRKMEQKDINEEHLTETITRTFKSEITGKKIERILVITSPLKGKALEDKAEQLKIPFSKDSHQKKEQIIRYEKHHLVIQKMLNKIDSVKKLENLSKEELIKIYDKISKMDLIASDNLIHYIVFKLAFVNLHAEIINENKSGYFDFKSFTLFLYKALNRTNDSNAPPVYREMTKYRGLTVTRAISASEHAIIQLLNIKLTEEHQKKEQTQAQVRTVLKDLSDNDMERLIIRRGNRIFFRRLETKEIDGLSDKEINLLKFIRKFIIFHDPNYIYTLVKEKGIGLGYGYALQFPSSYIGKKDFLKGIGYTNWFNHNIFKTIKGYKLWNCMRPNIFDSIVIDKEGTRFGDIKISLYNQLKDIKWSESEKLRKEFYEKEKEARKLLKIGTDKAGNSLVAKQKVLRISGRENPFLIANINRGYSSTLQQYFNSLSETHYARQSIPFFEFVKSKFPVNNFPQASKYLELLINKKIYKINPNTPGNDNLFASSISRIMSASVLGLNYTAQIYNRTIGWIDNRIYYLFTHPTMWIRDIYRKLYGITTITPVMKHKKILGKDITHPSLVNRYKKKMLGALKTLNFGNIIKDIEISVTKKMISETEEFLYSPIEFVETTNQMELFLAMLEDSEIKKLNADGSNILEVLSRQRVREIKNFIIGIHGDYGWDRPTATYHFFGRELFRFKGWLPAKMMKWFKKEFIDDTVLIQKGFFRTHGTVLRMFRDNVIYNEKKRKEIYKKITKDPFYFDELTFYEYQVVMTEGMEKITKLSRKDIENLRGTGINIIFIILTGLLHGFFEDEKNKLRKIQRTKQETGKEYWAYNKEFEKMTKKERQLYLMYSLGEWFTSRVFSDLFAQIPMFREDYSTTMKNIENITENVSPSVSWLVDSGQVFLSIWNHVHNAIWENPELEKKLFYQKTTKWGKEGKAKIWNQILRLIPGLRPYIQGKEAIGSYNTVMNKEYEAPKKKKGKTGQFEGMFKEIKKTEFKKGEF